jgi:hypothetical protein
MKALYKGLIATGILSVAAILRWSAGWSASSRISCR